MLKYNAVFWLLMRIQNESINKFLNLIENLVSVVKQIQVEIKKKKKVIPPFCIKFNNI